MKRASISRPSSNNWPPKPRLQPPPFRPSSQYNPRPTRPRYSRPPPQWHTQPSSSHCTLCSRSKPHLAHSHTVAFCPQLSDNEKRHIRAVTTEHESDILHDNDTDHVTEEVEDESQYSTTYDDYEEEDSTANTRMVQTSVSNIIQIKRVNVMESPILTLSSGEHTVYLILDTGATSSLISHKMTLKLHLQIHKTSHKAVQVDGESQLPILGEVHTTFKRGNKELVFSGLVVENLSVDILTGTNFHVENDVFSRMSKGTIHIGDNVTVHSAPPSLLTLSNTSTHRLVRVPYAITVLPGDLCTFQAPTDIPPDCVVMIEPNVRQSPPFFTPAMTKLDQGRFSVENTSPDPVVIKKNSQAVILYTTSDFNKTSPPPLQPTPVPPTPPVELKVDQIIKSVHFDGNLSKNEKEDFFKIISQHSSVFQQDLPGYNNAFGTVNATFDFASKARPVAQKLRSPNYGSIQDSLFNQKCEQLQSRGVLIDPLSHDIQ